MSHFNPAQLLNPAAYPHRPRQIKFVETHISWVFLAGDRVYKIKKPVDFGFLNYSTLSRRKHYCHEEVRLNSRLCADAYIGVEKIVAAGDGLQIGGPGRAVEYAVVMQRLPNRRMLDYLIRKGQVGEDTIDRVAARIASFHAVAEVGPNVDQFGSVDSIRGNWQENFDQIKPYVGQTISAGRLETIRDYVTEFVDQHHELFQQRQQDGRIRDCHGDMRAESICLTDGLCIFDCIEFSARLRCGDTASELAFLAMDIDARGRPDLAYWLIDRYIEASGDRALRKLLLFYASYRAFVRGKVQSFRLDQAVSDERFHRTVQRRARHYLRLAWLYARVLSRSLLILVVGLPGTGKTTMARSLAMRLGAVAYSSDRVRKELAGVEATYRTNDDIDAGLYSSEMSRSTYAALRDRTSESLAAGQSVVLDATYRTRAERKAVIDIALSHGTPCWIVECQLPESAALDRIAERRASGEGASDADATIYRVQRSRFEPIEASEGRHLIVDTGKPIASTASRVVEQIVHGVPA